MEEKGEENEENADANKSLTFYRNEQFSPAPRRRLGSQRQHKTNWGQGSPTTHTYAYTSLAHTNTHIRIRWHRWHTAAVLGAHTERIELAK